MVVYLVLLDNIANICVVMIVRIIVTRVHREHIVTECMDINAVLVVILLATRYLVRFALLESIHLLDNLLVLIVQLVITL